VTSTRINAQILHRENKWIIFLLASRFINRILSSLFIPIVCALYILFRISRRVFVWMRNNSLCWYYVYGSQQVATRSGKKTFSRARSGKRYAHPVRVEMPTFSRVIFARQLLWELDVKECCWEENTTNFVSFRLNPATVTQKTYE